MNNNIEVGMNVWSANMDANVTVLDISNDYVFTSDGEVTPIDDFLTYHPTGVVNVVTQSGH